MDSISGVNFVIMGSTITPTSSTLESMSSKACSILYTGIYTKKILNISNNIIAKIITAK